MFNKLNFLLDSAILSVPIITGLLILNILRLAKASWFVSIVTGTVMGIVFHGILWYLYNIPLDALGLSDGYIIYWSVVGIIAIGGTWYWLYKIFKATNKC